MDRFCTCPEIVSGGEEGLQAGLGGILQVWGNTEGDLLGLVGGHVHFQVHKLQVFHNP